MFEVWGGLNDTTGLGETKASILARGCVKVRKRVFRCPDGSEVSPSDEVASPTPPSPTLPTIPRGPQPAVPISCPPGQSWVLGHGCLQIGTSSPGGGDTSAMPESPAGGGSGVPAPGAGGSFLDQRVLGIPVLYLLIGAGAIFLLKKR